MLAARPVFLIATVILLAALAGWLAGFLPAPRNYEIAFRTNPYSRQSLLMLSAGMAAGWTVLVLPWSVLLSLRLRARQRRRSLAVVPAALTAIAIAGVALAGALLGGPPPGQQAENPAPYLSWANGDFILLDSIVMAALTTGAAALIFGLALTFEALRPDIRDIDDVFS